MPNTVSEMLPGLVAEWSEKNLPLTPGQLTYGSNRKVWWKGKCGHEWLASPHSRSSGAGCPYCSGNRIDENIYDALNFDAINTCTEEWIFRV